MLSFFSEYIQEDDKPLSSNGVNPSTASMLNNEGDHATVQWTSQEEKFHPGSDDAVKNSVDDITRANNNEISSDSEKFLPDVALASTSNSEEQVGDEQSGSNIFQQDQEQSASNKLNETQTEHVLDPVNGSMSSKSAFEEPQEEAKTTATNGVNSIVDSEQPDVFSSSGSDLITQDDNSLVTVIQGIYTLSSSVFYGYSFKCMLVLKVPMK